MEIRQLKHFIAVAKLGTISAAAKQLNLAQPALSQSIKKLEQSLNNPLFHRRDRGVSLSEAGKQFLPHAQQILQQISDASQSIHDLGELSQGEVRLAVPSMIGSYFFPPLLMAFKHRYPGLSINIEDGGTQSIRQRLLDRQIELGVIATDNVLPEFETRYLIKEEMVVCMAPDHPLAAFDKIEYQDFLAHDLVLFQKGYYHHTLIEKISNQQGLEPKVAFSSNLLPLIKSVIRQGYAISPMWKVAIQADDQIITRPFSIPFYIKLSLAWRSDSYLSRANQAFRDFVLNELQN